LTGLVAVLLLAGAAAAEDHPLPEPPPGRRIDYSAERVEYDADARTLHLSTGVVVKESTWTVKGRDVWIDLDRRVATSRSPILIESPAGALYGDSGEFDLASHTARLFGTAGAAGEWTIRGREAELYPDKSGVYRGADFTSCDAKPPHYHFHATRVALAPKSRLSAWNVLFYLGDVHASQGDTEFTGTAAETTAAVRVSLDLIKGRRVPWMRIEKPDSIAAIRSVLRRRTTTGRRISGAVASSCTPPESVTMTRASRIAAMKVR